MYISIEAVIFECIISMFDILFLSKILVHIKETKYFSNISCHSFLKI